MLDSNTGAKTHQSQSNKLSYRLRYPTKIETGIKICNDRLRNSLESSDRLQLISISTKQTISLISSHQKKQFYDQ